MSLKALQSYPRYFGPRVLRPADGVTRDKFAALLVEAEKVLCFYLSDGSVRAIF